MHDYINGEYVLRLNSPTSKPLVALYLPDLEEQPNGTTNVSVAFSVRFEGADNQDNAVVGCRAYDGEMTGYRIWLEHNERRFGVERWTDGVKVDLVPSTVDNRITAYGTNRIELICVENTIVLRVNGYEIARVIDTDAPHLNGHTWIAVDVWDDFDDEGNVLPAGVTEAHVDNLTMTIPSEVPSAPTPTPVE